MDKRCSGPNSRLDNVVDFKCKICLNPTVSNDKKIRFGNVEYEVFDQFCYLGEMLNAHGGAEISPRSCIRSDRK